LFSISRDTVKPVIAAINGHAIAGGMELVMGTDIRVAVPGAKFGLQEVKWALLPAGASTVRLPRQMPRPRQSSCCADRRSDRGGGSAAPRLPQLRRAARAAARSLPGDAGKIVANGPVAVSRIRRSVIECDGHPEAEALAIERPTPRRSSQPRTPSKGRVRSWKSASPSSRDASRLRYGR
jgi:enoyl-CoA hydratase